MTSEFQMTDDATRPQALRIDWERCIIEDDLESSPLERMDPVDDAERIAAFNNEDWSFVGIVAKATLYIPIAGSSFRLLTVESAGLWGIESDSGEAYFNEIFEDEKAQLLSELRTLGELLPGASVALP